MSIDDLLPLIFVAWFLVSLVQRGQRNARRRGRNAPPPSAPEGTPRETAGDASPSLDADTPRGGGSMLDELERRILEAQRRVAEASGDAPANAPTGTAGGEGAEPRPSAVGSTTVATTPSQAPARPTALPTGAPTVLQSPRPAVGGAGQGFLGREGLPPSRSAASRPPAGFLGREGSSGPPSRRAEVPSKVVRPATKAAPALFPLQESDVVRGVVWSTVLGEPAARRFRRRQPSRRR